MRIPDDAQGKDRRDTHMIDLPITYTLFLGKDSRHLDAEITIDNRARQHRLRVLFPTYFGDAEVSRGGQPFDVVSRPIFEETGIDGLSEQPWPTHPMQDICDVAGANAGLTVAAEGIFEYECIDTPARPLALTLLRCNNYINQEWTTLLPEAAENIGEITYKLALFPHDGDWKNVYGDAIGYLTAPAFTLNRQPEESVMVDYVPAERTLPDAGSAVSITGANLMITAVKQSWNGKSLVVRVLNYGEDEQVGRLTLTYPGRIVKHVYKTDLDENRTGEIANVGNSVVFALRAAGLATFEIEME
jgi:alpha-mannosidase